MGNRHATPASSTAALDTLGPRHEREASALIAKHWHAVVDVADALLQRRTLPAAEVARLICAAR